MKKQAHRIYPQAYQVNFTEEELSTLRENTFNTHESESARILHKISESILLPSRWMMQLFARMIKPDPGEAKSLFTKMGIRLFSFIGFFSLIPLAMISFPLGFSLKNIDHTFRRTISYFYTPNAALENKQIEMTKEKPLHIRTHNLGFVPKIMGILGDLRSPIKRAEDLVKDIASDPNQPDIINFQEAFNEDANEILCKGLKTIYPHIIHNVAPHISGFNSGAMIMSKYPIKAVEFIRFDNMVNPDSIAPRGILKTTVSSTKGDVVLYNIHTQSLLGKNRADARNLQIQKTYELMEKDSKASPGIHQIVMGDFNTSEITAWGESNRNPEGQSEASVLNTMDDLFIDPFLRDHNKVSGKREKKTAFFLENDNRRMNTPHLTEPSGSWYHGPFAKKGILLSLKERFTRWYYNEKAPSLSTDIQMPKTLSWGTPKWREEQAAQSARFDYILFPKYQQKLKARVEIRRVCVPEKAVSASTDHLPLDARVYLKK